MYLTLYGLRKSGPERSHCYSFFTLGPAWVDEDIWCLMVGSCSTGYDIQNSLVVWLHFSLSHCHAVISGPCRTWQTGRDVPCWNSLLFIHTLFLISARKHVGRNLCLCHPFLLFNKYKTLTARANYIFQGVLVFEIKNN